MERIEELFEAAKKVVADGSTTPMTLFIERMSDPANRTPNGTFKKWVESRGLGSQIEKYQVSFSAWYAGVRELDSTRSSNFTLNGSRTDYAGHTVLHATDTELFVVENSQDGAHHAFYRVVE